MIKEKALLDYAIWFYSTLAERCIRSCGRAMSTLELPVFKKFLNYRVNRELEFNKACISLASILYENRLTPGDDDIEELLQTSKVLDKKLMRDIKLLPLRINFDYEKIIPLRLNRIRLMLGYFLRLLNVEGARSYDDMVRGAFDKVGYLDINNDILDLYSEEAFIVNSTIKSIIKIDAETLAHRMYCMMVDVGHKLNREIAERIFV